MFCKNCGEKIKDGVMFCANCGRSTALNKTGSPEIKKPDLVTNDKWWQRLLKVLYAIAHIPLIVIIPLVWGEYARYCTRYGSYNCYGSVGEQIFYSLITLLIYIIIMRAIKITFLYIILGVRPSIKREIKKLF